MPELYDLDVDQYLADCIHIDNLNLQDEFVRLPADLAYWNERYSQAQKAYLGSKLVRERIEADLHIKLREELMSLARMRASSVAASKEGKEAKVSVKSPTMDDIASSVTTHPEFIEAKEREIDMEVEKSRLWGVIDAVRAKKDMLIQLGAQVRAEMAGDPTLRAQMRDSRMGEGL